MQDAPVEIGEILAGKFRVERILGVGGMGVVVAAMHLHLDKRVALKFMLESASKSEEVAARFLREAKAAARLRNEHIAQVLDVGTLESGAPYMVLEFLEGGDLEQVIEQRMASGSGPLPFAEAVGYLMQACLGMAEAHSHNFVHRDLKPPNLFRTTGPDGQALIKILDFGIAKAAIDGIATKTQAVMGSPFYMSPEQWQGAKDVDERGDIWALGAILQFLLSGSAPFQGDSLPTLFAKIATEPPASLAAPQLRVPQGLQDIVLRCLQKNPDDRPQDVAQLAALLVPFGPEHAAELARKARALMISGPRSSTRSGTSDSRAADQAPAKKGPTGAYAGKLAQTIANDGPVPVAAVSGIKQATTMSANSGEVVRASLMEPRSGKAKLPMIAAAVLLLGVGLVGLQSLRSDSGAKASASEQRAEPVEVALPAEASASTSPPQVAAQPLAPTEITIELTSTPSGAAVYRAADSVRIGHTPYKKQATPTEGELDLILKLDGHQDASVSIALGEDVRRNVELTPLELGKPSSEKKSSRHGSARKAPGTPKKSEEPVTVKAPLVPAKTVEPVAPTKKKPTGVWEENL